MMRNLELLGFMKLGTVQHAGGIQPVPGTSAPGCAILAHVFPHGGFSSGPTQQRTGHHITAGGGTLQTTSYLYSITQFLFAAVGKALPYLLSMGACGAPDLKCSC